MVCTHVFCSNFIIILSLSCRMRELELEDRQYEIDKELNELGQIPCK